MILSAEFEAYATGRIGDIHDRVDDRASIGIGILDDVGDRIGLRIEEPGNVRLD